MEISPLQSLAISDVATEAMPTPSPQIPLEHRQQDSIASVKPSHNTEGTWSCLKMIVASGIVLAVCAIAAWIMKYIYRDEDQAAAFQTAVQSHHSHISS